MTKFKFLNVLYYLKRNSWENGKKERTYIFFIDDHLDDTKQVSF